MAIYKLDNVGFPILDEVEVGMVLQYRRILKPVKTSKGDADGRKKLLNYKELAFVWYMSDFKSDGVQQGYSDEQLFRYAKKQAELPGGWTIYKDIEDAIKYYKEQQDTVIIRLNKSLLRSLNDANDTVVLISDLVRDKINVISQARSSGNVDNVDLLVEVGALINLRKELLLISKEIPIQMEAQKNYAEALKKEEETIRLGVGGGKIPSSAL